MSELVLKIQVISTSNSGTFLVVWWLRLCASLALGLVMELKSHMLRAARPKHIKTKN